MKAIGNTTITAPLNATSSPAPKGKKRVINTEDVDGNANAEDGSSPPKKSKPAAAKVKAKAIPSAAPTTPTIVKMEDGSDTQSMPIRTTTANGNKA